MDCSAVGRIRVTLKLRYVNKFVALHCAVILTKRRAELKIRKPATFN